MRAKIIICLISIVSSYSRASIHFGWCRPSDPSIKTLVKVSDLPEAIPPVVYIENMTMRLDQVGNSRNFQSLDKTIILEPLDETGIYGGKVRLILKDQLSLDLACSF